MDVINFVTENAEGIVTALIAIHAAAVAVVNLTDTPKIDGYLKKAYSVLEFAAGIVSDKAKDRWSQCLSTSPSWRRLFDL